MRRFFRLVLSAAAVIVMGAAAGMLSSQLLWGYFWKPPHLLVPAGSQVTSWSMAIYPRESEGEPVVFSVPERNRSTAHEASLHPRDRTWGWALSPWDPLYLSSLPPTEVGIMRRAVDWAYAFFEAELGALDIGRAVVLSVDGGVGVVLMTRELGDDRHIVWMVNGRYDGEGLRLVSTDRYSVEIAGIEFLTPPVLVTLWTVMFSAVAVLWHLFRWLSRIGRRP